jgi:hypothetical protein
MRLLVESELELLISVSLLLLVPPVELESELESSDVFDDTPTFESTPVGNSDPSTALTGPPSVSRGLFLSSVMVVPQTNRYSNRLIVSSSFYLLLLNQLRI